MDHRSDCPIASTLDLIGDRWTLVVLRDVAFFDKHTFTEFSASDENVAPNILADRLRRLEDAGCIIGTPDPADRRSTRYELTDKGRELVPLLVDMAKWGMRHFDHTGKDASLLDQFNQ